MSIKHNLEQWIAQLDYDDTCDISDRQVSELIRGYSDLEAKCAVLAAENAALNKFIDDDCYVYGPHDVEPVDAAIEKPQTPSTDAFLSEVRAQGVDIMVTYHMARADALKEVDRNGAFNHKSAALDASGIAAQLRQEAAQ